MTLSDAGRLEAIERLSASPGDAADAPAAWDAEIDRRLDAVAAGRAAFIP